MTTYIKTRRPKELSCTIKQMASNHAVLKDMSSRARAYYERHFVSETVYGRFAQYLEDLAGTPQ